MARYMSGKDCVVLQGGEKNVKPVSDFVLKEGAVALVDNQAGAEALDWDDHILAVDGSHLYIPDKDGDLKRISLTDLV